MILKINYEDIVPLGNGVVGHQENIELLKMMGFEFVDGIKFVTDNKALIHLNPGKLYHEKVKFINTFVILKDEIKKHIPRTFSCDLTEENLIFLNLLGYKFMYFWKEVSKLSSFKETDILVISEENSHYLAWNSEEDKMPIHFENFKNHITKISEEKSHFVESKSKEILKINKELIRNTKKKNHCTHYLKFNLNNKGLSVRYHYHFQDKPELENKWILKDHNTKNYSILDELGATILIQQLAIDSGIEIIGRMDKGVYRKIIVNNEQLELIKE